VYALTPKGERRLGVEHSDWLRFMEAMQRVLTAASLPALEPEEETG
jgi:hypothetical protein